MSKYYIAYGSNMDTDQMAYRCPEATLVDTGEIAGWEYLFKGSYSGSYATIERNKGAKPIPVYVWAVTAEDEQRLDHYEGFPTFYYKTNIPVKLHKDGRIVHGMVYIMHEERHLGIPSGKYFNNIRAIYESHKWDTEILWDALDKSTDHIKSEAKKH
jgi:gamma-glutamylcyclotransferase (GGCT)/AIG2-like uncharacterized protein YtfP